MEPGRSAESREQDAERGSQHSILTDEFFKSLRAKTVQNSRLTSGSSLRKQREAPPSSSLGHTGVSNGSGDVARKIEFCEEEEEEEEEEEDDDDDDDDASRKHPVADIRRMTKRNASSLRVGQVILDAAAVVKELVENSLDAAASRVDIRLAGKAGSQRISVSDNGSGIHIDSRSTLCEAHTTSKLSQFSDLDEISTYGFRGEALAAIAALSESVTVTTRTESEQVAQVLTYNHEGKLLVSGTAARPVGTTIQVEKLFARLPVRYEDAIKHSSREIYRCLSIVQTYALIATHVRFEVRVESEVKLLVQRQADHGQSPDDVLRSRIASILGSAQIKKMIPCSTALQVFDAQSHRAGSDVKKPDRNDKVCPDNCQRQAAETYNLRGFISGAAGASKDGGNSMKSTGISQFLYMNGRPVEMPRLKRAINDSFRRHAINCTACPTYVLLLKAPAGSLDVNVSPDKRQVMLSREAGLIAAVQQHLEQLWNPMEQRQIPVCNNLISVSLRSASSIAGSCPKSSSLPPRQAPTSLQMPFKDSASDAAADAVVATAPSIEQEAGNSADYKSNGARNNSGGDGNCALDLASDHLEASSRCSRPGIKSVLSLPAKRGYSKRVEAFVSRKKTTGQKKAGNPAECDSSELNDLTAQFTRSSEKRSPPHKSGQICKYYAHPAAMQQTDCVSGIDDIVQQSDSRENALNGTYPQSVKADGVEPPPVTDIGNCRGMDSVKNNLVASIPYSLEAVQAHRAARRSHHVKRKKRQRSCLSESPIDTAEPPSQMPRFEKSTVAEICGPGSCEHSGPETDADKKDAEEELVLTFRQEWFRELKIIGQFNSGFIICVLGDSDLFIVDQHASDEKFNYEDLERCCVIQSQMLVTPLALHLSAEDELLVHENLDRFKTGGFDIVYRPSKPPTQRLYLHSQPFSKRTMFVQDDLREMIAALKDEGLRSTAGTMQVLRPPRVRAMLASRACRKSVMIGTALSRNSMTRIVRNMADLRHPWMCPHGRPTMRHLCKTDQFCSM